MDWQAAIEKNRQALTRILAALFAMVRDTAEIGMPAGRRTLPRYLHRAVLRLLRPAEAAARRLIIVTARGMAAPPRRTRRNGPGSSPPIQSNWRVPTKHDVAAGSRERPPALPLFDPLPRWRSGRRPVAVGVPRIRFPGYSAPVPVVPRLPLTPDDAIDAARLCLRLRALAAALDDLPAHARRFARWRARRDRLAVNGEGRRDSSRRRDAARRVWPLRPGRPPGLRKARRGERSSHEVDEVLAVVHELALWAMERPDTS